MTKQTINIGTVVNDGTGDTIRDAFDKVNDNTDELYIGVPHPRLDVSDTNLTASFRDDGTGKLGWYIGAAGATDNAQTLALALDTSRRFGFFADPAPGYIINVGGPVLINGTLRLGQFNGSGQIANISDDTLSRVIDIDLPTLSTAAGSVRIFRNTNTAGVRTFQLYRGDGSLTVDHRLDSGNTGTLVTLARNGGFVGIGTSTANVPLDVYGSNAVTTTDVLVVQAGTAGVQNSGARIHIGTRAGVSRGVSIEGRNISGSGQAHDMIFSTSASSATPTEAMRIRFDNKVGIGTAAPGGKLEVREDQNTATSFVLTNANTGTASDTRIILNSSNASGVIILRGAGHTSPGQMVFSTNSTTEGMAFWTNGAEHMRITNSGFVGIGGVSSPVSALTVQGDTAGAAPNSAPTVGQSKESVISIISNGNQVGSGGAVEFGGTANKTFAAIRGYALSGGNNAAGDLDFYTRNSIDDAAMSHRMKIHYLGNVGIGTTTSTPGAKLEIVGGTTNGAIDTALIVQGGTAAVAGSGSRIILSGGSVGGARGSSISTINTTGGTNAHDLILATSSAGASPTERMRITSSGNVGIGTTSPAQALHVVGRMLVDTTTSNNTIKGTLIGSNIYDTSNLPFFSMFTYCDSTENYVSWGGGTVLGTSATIQRWYTAANNTTNAGTLRMTLTSAGNLGVGTSVPLAPLHALGTILSASTSTDNLTKVGTFGTPHYTNANLPLLGMVLSSNTSENLVSYGGGTSAGNAATVHRWRTAADSNTATGTIRLELDNAGTLRPGADNTQTLGAASFRWSVVYAGTGTINTSDARAKTPVRALQDKEIAAAKELAKEIGVYQWLDSVAEKGDAARLHIGMTVQRAIEIMEKNDLDPWRYGFICKDDVKKTVTKKVKRKVEKTKVVEESYTEIEVIDGVPTQIVKTRNVEQVVTKLAEVVDSSGNVVLDADGNPTLYPVPVMCTKTFDETEEVDDGYRLGFRYDQLNSFMIRGLAESVKGI